MTFDQFTQGMIGFMSSMCCSSKREEFLENWHTDSAGGRSRDRIVYFVFKLFQSGCRLMLG